MHSKQSESLVQRRLQQLPPPRAPETLLPRVMAAARQQARPRWYRQPWVEWPLVCQAASVALLAALAPFVPFALEWIGAGVFTRAAGDAAAGVAVVTDDVNTLARVLWRGVSGTGSRVSGHVDCHHVRGRRRFLRRADARAVGRERQPMSAVRQSFVVLAVALGLALATVQAAAQSRGGDGPVVMLGEDYTVAAGERVEDVVVIGGSATIEGEVDGDAVAVMGDITLAGTARVEGRLRGGPRVGDDRTRCGGGTGSGGGRRRPRRPARFPGRR